MDITSLLADRSRLIDSTPIRRVFELGAGLKDPVNLGIGQPEYELPKVMADAACDAIRTGKNGYTVTQGILPLREKLAATLKDDLGWTFDLSMSPAPGTSGVMVNSGSAGSLLMAFMAVANPGDEIVIPDPYFAFYPHMVTVAGAKAVRCETYPDFLMTAERVERVMTPRTKMVLVNSPSNPAGSVLSASQCADLADLCRRRGVILVSDEIYCDLTFESALEAPPASCVAKGASAAKRCPSPGRFPGAEENTLVVRGFGKTYAVTGWRLGYAAGPAPLINQMQEIQQYVNICPPAPLQWGALAAPSADAAGYARNYERRAAMVTSRLGKFARVSAARGSFYVFIEVPPKLNMSGQQFFERCLRENLLIIPGYAVSGRDTHFRVSLAAPDAMLERGVEILDRLMR